MQCGDDHVNAAHARLLEIRRWLLIGQLDVAEQLINELSPAELPAALRATYELVLAGIAVRRFRAKLAGAALDRAAIAAQETRIPPLITEVESAALVLNRLAARQISNGEEQLLLLDGVVLLARAFGAKFVDDSHRARLRVEIARLRAELGSLAAVTATKLGLVLTPHGARTVCLLAWAVDEEHASLLAFLGDGEAWSTSALALALGASQRTVQRAIDALAATGKVQAFCHGRARRWMSASIPGFTTALLLPAQLSL